MTNGTPKCNLSESSSLLPLSELCVANTGFVDPTRTPNIPFRYVDISSVDNRRKCIAEPKTLLGKEAPSRARQAIRANDVLVATTRPNLNAVAIVPPELDGSVCSTGFCVLRSNGRVAPEYLFAFVQSEPFVRCLSDLVQGALYPAVTDKQVRSQPIPFRELAEQQTFATRLREQLAEAELARVAVEEQLNAAEALPNAILRAVFSAPAAQKWPCQKLAEILTKPLRTGLSKQTSATSNTRCLTLSAVRAGKLDFSASKPIDVTEREIAQNQIQPGAFYVVRGNGNISLVARGGLAPVEIQAPVLFPDLLIEVRPNPELMLASFLRWAWDAPFIRQALEKKSMTSAGIYKINLTNLANVEIPVPPVTEQQAIAARINSEFDQFQSLRQNLAQKLAAVEKIPAALLRQAFSAC